MFAAWESHFEQLGTSKVPKSATLHDVQSNMSSYQSSSLQNEDYILDTEINIEEIEAAIIKLKRGKSCGPDGILPEHYYHVQWSCFQAVVEEDFETVPTTLLNAIIVPVYKDKGIQTHC